MSTLCYILRDGKALMLHRTVKKHDVNHDKWIGVGGHFEREESPEECLLREVREETGYTLTSWRFRGIVTFVSGDGVTEYMFLYTADGFTGEPVPCDEGELAWVEIERIWSLNIWEGDKIFFRLIDEEAPFFSLKLVYDGHGRLRQAVRDGQPMELFDILGEDGRPTGLVRERGVAHREGSPHGTVHMWIVRRSAEGRVEVLLQKRAQGKDSNPGDYDISSAGHMSAGDVPLQAAIREIGEELGIVCTEEDLQHIGDQWLGFDGEFYGRPFHDRELAHVYLYSRPVEISSLTLQKEEIEEVRWMDFGQLREAVRMGTLPNCIYEQELELVGRALGVE